MSNTSQKNELNKNEQETNNEKYDILSRFRGNNPHSLVTYEKETVVISNLWGEAESKVQGSVNDNNLIRSLNSICFNPMFTALFHPEKKLIEFIYAYLDPEDESTGPLIGQKVYLSL